MGATLQARAAASARLPFADALEVLGEVVLLSTAALRHLASRPFEFRLLLDQLYQVGVRSLSIVNLTAVFMGMVLALQLGVFLAKFGAENFVSRIVGLSVLREMAPVLSALMVGGRVGAGITAELGSMKVTEQIDAIRSLGADPIRQLVVPRLLALVIMVPLLTVIADAVGIAGGCLIAVLELDMSADFYWTSLLQVLVLSDFFSGLGKSVFFAYFIGVIACRNGLTVTGGADGVGRATTSSVVAASVTVLISDFFLSKVFLAL